MVIMVSVTRSQVGGSVFAVAAADVSIISAIVFISY